MSDSSKSKKNNPYEKCFCYNEVVCGPFKRWNKDGIFSVVDLTADISSHFQALKLKLSNEWNEKLLIENRFQNVLPEDGSICSYHRYSLRIGWKAPKRCQHPEHEFVVGKKAPPTRTVPWHTLTSFNTHNPSLPIGTVFCYPHIKAETERMNDHHPFQDHSPVGISTPNDEGYIPDEVVVSDEVIERAACTASSLCSTLVSSPLAYQIKQKRIADLSESTKQKLRQKLARLQENLEKRFAEAIAPGQSEELITNVLHFQDEEEKEIPDDLIVPLQLYDESDSLGKLVILSLINHQKYSKEELMDHFNCSRYQVDQARKLQGENSGLSIPQKEKQTRCRIPEEKIEHFLEFLFSSGLLQDVAYGVNKIKFDSGEEQKVSNAILTMKYSHTISYYKQICCESLYTPLSDTSLWRVLHGIKPSQRQALAGLDDVTAAGMNGFSTLSKVAENMKEKDVVKTLEKGKRYLKSTYPAKCAGHSVFRTHSTTFALSDDTDVDLMELTFAISDEDCADCVELLSSMDKVRKLVEERCDDDLMTSI